MGRIRVLPDRLIDRIAAGEVVERPASVVKELLENALDAGARSIRLTLRSGGRRLIRLVDDGCGMDRDDAFLAVERHATSKLTDASDLAAIRTLGFRGEALSSIAAVSSFLLRTSIEDGPGTEIRIRGGKIESVREAGLPRGTTIEVERLFFNVPARRKFLRSVGTELGHILRWVTRCALSRPDLRFHVEHDDRSVLSVEPVTDTLQRIGQIYGKEFREKLLPFDATRGSFCVRGYTGRPAAAVTRRDGQHAWVNGRSVQDRLMSKAATDAFAHTVPRGYHVPLFLFLDLPLEEVDVNVHPQKSEVRFTHPQQMIDAVRESIAGALRHDRAVPELADLRPESSPSESVRRAVDAYLDSSAPLSDRPISEPRRSWEPVAGTSFDPPVPTGPGEPLVAPPDLIEAAETVEKISTPRVAPLAQYRDSYIVAQDAEGLVVVDQHAAHERVLFEQYLHEAESDEVPIQQLLFPLTVELTPDELVQLTDEADEFRRLGFRVEPFGGNTVRLDAVPAVIGDRPPEPLLRELLGEAAKARSARAGLSEVRRRLITTASCQAAIKIHYPLSRDSMQSLLDDLFRTANPTTCPHGRPLLFRLTLDEIERAFDRR